VLKKSVLFENLVYKWHCKTLNILWVIGLSMKVQYNLYVSKENISMKIFNHNILDQQSWDKNFEISIKKLVPFLYELWIIKRICLTVDKT